MSLTFKNIQIMKRLKLIALLIITTAALHATVYYVSPDGDGTTGLSWETAYKTPAAALAGSPVAGDEVWVQQATYVSAATLNWKTAINFYGGFAGTETERNQRSADASLTILEGTNTNKVLNAPAMASPTTWDGFTIQKGYATGGGAGIFMQKNAILENCIVQDNVDTGWGGAGIYIQGATDDSIKVINCVVRNNIAYTSDGRTDKHGGGGIRIRPDAPKAVVRGTIIENNILDAKGTGNGVGGGVYIAAGTIENSIIRNNTATNINPGTEALVYNGKVQGGGIFVMPQNIADRDITIRNCTITGNETTTHAGGGMSIDPLWTSTAIIANVLVQNNYITNNKAYRNGGGIMTDGQKVTSTADYTFTNCVIANNSSSAVAAAGGGAFVNNIGDYGGKVNFINCTVANNKMLTTNYGGGGIFYNNLTADVSNCVFWGNGSVGALAPYHLRVKTDITTNKIVNCAFDNRFVEAQVSPAGYEADLTGLVIIEQSNEGAEEGKLYPYFESPTDFIGAATNESEKTAIEEANWAIGSASALRNKGKTIVGLDTDIIGADRPMEGVFDIGAYEYDIATGYSQNQNLSRIYGSNGRLFVNNIKAKKSIQVYDMMGVLVKSLDARDGLQEISLPANQIYIVKVDSKSTKIIL
ncbi:MAG: right-handed parallel beta-helix repeat-containing protein [Pigmentiphaga sp.]|nr:right-handed parallel beta-helix repeat-containing protein [Pigmentiphaga sp.]